MNDSLSRRRFLRQSFAFSAAAALGRLPLSAAPMQRTDGSNWLMIGDWGYERFEAQKQVAAAMQQYVAVNRVKTDALIMLGDNWYGDMTGGVDSPRWKTQFEEMYPESTFNCKAYAMLGNHDYQRMPESKVDMQLAYARRGNTRWTMPARWYSFQFPATKPLATVIVLDSNVQKPRATKATGANFQMSLEDQAEQLRWLKLELAKPRTTPYLLVMAHHPIYSNGPHGDHEVLIAEWLPLLEQHKAHLYFAGHDHDMQHLEFEGHPTSFVLSGGGGADLYNLTIPQSQRGPSAEKVHGFTHLEMTAEHLTVKHFDEQCHLIHAFTKTPAGDVRILS
ncbi:MAG: metallophosphoesterase [Edaphobacter sp.]|uniref:metallophosphoesterase n=1 Tax=Edaphobacter sp. TaxID=1934404 RepID=UPI0023A20952|nr:metallophosphoesterase [Edaphobacter sp.]MDE1175121.1 metallophosphoesterase [Edaphobacter sp.]